MPLRSRLVLLIATLAPALSPEITGYRLFCRSPSCTFVCSTIGVLPGSFSSFFNALAVVLGERLICGSALLMGTTS